VNIGLSGFTRVAQGHTGEVSLDQGVVDVIVIPKETLTYCHPGIHAGNWKLALAPLPDGYEII